MGMLSEFKEFAMKGNVVDLAIGVIIGGAFGKIVSSFIDDVITPLLLKPALEAANLSKIEELTIFGGVKYGMFLSAGIRAVLINQGNQCFQEKRSAGSNRSGWSYSGRIIG